jgi:hypothetical protein
MADPSRDDKAGEAPSGDEKSWLLGLLVPLFYLVLLGCGVWLVLWRPDLLVDPRAQVAVWIVAGGAVGFAVFLFARQWKSGIWADKRGYMDMSRSQWRKQRTEDWDAGSKGP